MNDVPYYLTHFRQVLNGVEQQYGELLIEAEHRHLARLRALPLPAACLYVRLANRKGPYFRLAKLDYAECEPLGASIAMLLDAGLAVSCSGKEIPFARHLIGDCFTYPELRAALKQAGVTMLANKAECSEWLACDEAVGFIGQLLAQHAVICLQPGDPWIFFKFLFFGELTPNLSGFVVQELGHIVIEAPKPADMRPQFKSRSDARGCYEMAVLYQDFRELRAALPAMELLGWWKQQALQREHISQMAWETHDRLIDRLGRMLEREKCLEEAMELYETSPVAPCRERLVRLLIKQGRKEDAIALCRQMVEQPSHSEEAYTARQLLDKLERKSPRSQARQLMNEAEEIKVPLEAVNVETMVLKHQLMQGWQGVHSENWLWNTLFGLLFWDIIYDTRYGSFHQPLQMAPGDLYDAQFYKRRSAAFEERMTLLEDKAQSLLHLSRIHHDKQGIMNPFVAWHADNLFYLERLLHHVPSTAVAAILRHMAQDVKRHRRGFPDLFLWKTDDYRIIEVKSPNDQLSAQQYHWLQFFLQQGVKVQVLRVSFSEAETIAAIA